MGFGQAISTCFHKYVDFSGRARRSEYWWFVLFAFIVYVVFIAVGLAVHVPVILVLAYLALLLPSLAVAVRRLHDTDKTGWWMLIGLVPFGGIVLLVFFVQDSTPPNKYGESPKSLAGTAPGMGSSYGQAPSWGS